jgi:hypothetical protein
MKTLIVAAIRCSLMFFGLLEVASSNPGEESIPSELRSGTLQKMIVESGSATIEIDLNRLNGISSTNNPASITIGAPITETATFTHD